MKRITSYLIILCLALLTAPAGANPKVNINSFKPSLHAWDVGSVMTTRIAPHLKLSGGMWLSYRHKPWVIETPMGATQVVKHQLMGEFNAALPLWGYLSVGLGIPIAFTSQGDDPALVPVLANAGFTRATPEAVFGDLRLDFKVRFWKRKKHRASAWASPSSSPCPRA